MICINDHRVLLLDLDDTLIPDNSAARAAIGETLTELGAPAGDVQVDQVLSTARDLWRIHPHRQHPGLVDVSSWEALWLPTCGQSALSPAVTATLISHERHVWATALAVVGGDPRADAAAAILYRNRRHARLELLPGVAAALAAATEAGYQLWLVTNGAAALQRLKIQVTGLSACVGRVFISGEIGASKPAKAFADAVRGALDTDRLGVCQLIGDSMSTDIALALAAGWPATHLCPLEPCPDTRRHAGVRHTQSLVDAVSGCEHYWGNSASQRSDTL